MYKVILYYQFADIDNVKRFCADHRRLCKSLNLFGRVYVAEEGINGTLAGRREDIDAYKENLRSQPGFEQTEFKEDPSDEIPFVKLIVRVRPEIVALKAGPLKPKEFKGNHLSPGEWRGILESGEDYVLIDVRNNYESKIGHFEGALKPDVENFYEFPDWLNQSNIQKDKKILMYCTGGIRCEKFSVLMEKNGYNDVNQLHGGIINYAHKEGAAHFKGKCFVFDDRLVVGLGKKDEEPISQCEVTGEPCDRYINCANPDCNKLFICSEKGATQMQGCCSEACKHSNRRHPFDPGNIYEPTRKWYWYFDKKPKVEQNT